MQSLSSAKQSFTNVKQKVKDTLYKADAPDKSLFADYKKSESKNFLIIKAPKDVIGIEGFEFDLLEEERLRMSSNITSHPVEDRSYLSDHISIEPLEITIKGVVGEVFVRRDKINQAVDIAREKLGILSQYKVPFTQSANQKITNLQRKTNKQVDYIKKIYSDGARLTDMFFKKNESEDLNRTQNALQFFRFLSIQRIPCNIVLNFAGLLKDMCIMEIDAVQVNYENVVSFTLTFKQMPFAKTESTTFKAEKSEVKKQIEANTIKKGSGNSKEQKVSTLKELSTSFLKSLF